MYASYPSRSNKESLTRIRANLLAEGYSEEEVAQAMQDAMDSKVSDIE